jgi:hypothetical protein
MTVLHYGWGKLRISRWAVSCLASGLGGVLWTAVEVPFIDD